MGASWCYCFQSGFQCLLPRGSSTDRKKSTWFDCWIKKWKWILRLHSWSLQKESTWFDSNLDRLLPLTGIVEVGSEFEWVYCLLHRVQSPDYHQGWESILKCLSSAYRLNPIARNRRQDQTSWWSIWCSCMAKWRKVVDKLQFDFVLRQQTSSLLITESEKKR